MHGLTGGNWKRRDLTTATEKNDRRETDPSPRLRDLPPGNATAPAPDPPIVIIDS